jgi:hypothetical protein
MDVRDACANLQIIRNMLTMYYELVDDTADSNTHKTVGNCIATVDYLLELLGKGIESIPNNEIN